MRIPNLKDLPDVAHRAVWARLLTTDYSTLYRAFEAKKLKGRRSKSGAVNHTREEILEWLGLVETTKK